MIQLTTDITKAKFITHKGTMHADEVFSTAFLELLYDDIVLMRTTEEQLSKRSEDSLVFDIGKGKFDHHQLDAKVRENGIKYASFGLLFQAFGKQLLQKLQIHLVDDVFDYMDRDFVLAIDAIDNGVFPNIQAEYHVKTVSDIIKLFNCSKTEAEENQQFLLAEAVAKTILQAEIKSINAKMEAKKEVEKLMATQKGPVLVLPYFMPYEETLLTLDKEKQFLFVVFPSNRGGYAAKAVPNSLSDHSNRLLFCSKWAGLSDKVLEEAAGVVGAKFCHSNRFLVTADTKEAVLALIQKTLEEKS